ncbi:putative 3-demethylubiquinone-9 3-methyltransferase (glyoxalase superfamily) [Microbacterium ginsengiterrae]|uniref:Putative 3-demethylubiquinone-9 3-methyltransferase (Glyoxalase superfamily) n=1 Tax=Microbacterium ginsengiterrae TaxID=546115 RepID=A0A7W9FD58_9MICO|nr:VOC family protein [Microbacterium ginsengiterrae]MBB5742919.1 putative 3-demethylubiquinone-9 3-methyltransferase (glyoxalase superfamily) [Microbacterium ginsengiterrae]
MSQKIVPNIWFDKNADEAGDFYAGLLPHTTAAVAATYPELVADWQAEFAGKTLTVDLDVDGYRLTLINAGPEFRPNPSVSFMLDFDPTRFGDDRDAARESLDAVWAGLSEGGRVRMELDEYSFSPRYGWVEDRYGVNWQLVLANPEGDTRPFLIPHLSFTRDVDGKAREAADFYTSLFPDSEVGYIALHSSQAVHARPGTVMFGELRLADQWFSMMDAGPDHDFAFDSGVSLEVRVADQEELDRYWDALTTDPEAEVCGWLVDRYGLSWQIVPENMGELMARPGAYEKMMKMKKLIIDDF